MSTSVTTITGAVTLDGAVFGKGSGEIFLADFECDGTEMLLYDCLTSGSGSAELSVVDTSDHNHTNVVGIRCIGKV